MLRIKKLIPVFIIFVMSCNSTHNKTAEIKTSEEEIYSPPKIELPGSESEITNGGMGVLHLGDPFSSIDQKFSNVDTLTMNSEGMDWPAKKIHLNENEWILAESNDWETITRLHTNSKKYKTRKGYYPGQTFTEILKSKGEIGLDFDEGAMSVRLYDESVSLNIDSLSEEIFYQSKNQNLSDIPQNAKVFTISIF